MVSRCMAIGEYYCILGGHCACAETVLGKREGPDILLVCSKDSNKIKEIEAINYVNLTFLNR